MLKRHKIAHINIAGFIALAIIMLPIFNSDLLYTWQEYGVFMKGSTFMNEMLSTYGFWAWAGCYLTQFFYYPWLGSLMLIAIWGMTYYLLVSSFGVKDSWTGLALIPIACFLISIVDVGYWIYYLESPGYCFSFSLCFLCAAALTWAISYVARRFIRWNPSVIVMPIALFAIGFRFPTFAHGEYTDNTLTIPFIVAAFSPLLLALPFHKFSVKNAEMFIAIILIPVVALADGKDNNFNSELKMYRAIDESRYEDVIAEAEASITEPTNLMVLYKNIALLHTNRLTEMFKINNCGTQPNADERLNVRIAQISGEMVYYQFGQINYAYRWAIENSVKRGLTNARLKMLARCSIFNQEFELAHKYLTLLKSTTFQRKWAIEHEQWVMRASTFFESKECQNLAPLIEDAPNVLDKDHGLCEKWLLTHFSEISRPTSQKLEDLIMCTSLWTEDTYSFLVHFYDYHQRHEGQPTPPLYQEALILLANSDSSPITLNNYPFDAAIKERYNAFVGDYQSLSQQGLKSEQIGERMKAAYGDTYWWYYYFYTDFVIY